MVYSFDDINGLESAINSNRLMIAKEEKEIYEMLDINQMQTLDKMLFSGTVGSILGKYSGSIFFKEK